MSRGDGGGEQHRSSGDQRGAWPKLCLWLKVEGLCQGKGFEGQRLDGAALEVLQKSVSLP